MGWLRLLSLPDLQAPAPREVSEGSSPRLQGASRCGATSLGHRVPSAGLQLGLVGTVSCLSSCFANQGSVRCGKGRLIPQAEPGQQVGMLVFHLTAKSNPKTAGD